jgi:hypothetical protein
MNPFHQKSRSALVNFWSKALKRSADTGRLPQVLPLYIAAGYVMYNLGLRPGGVSTHEERIADSEFYKKNFAEEFDNPIFSLPPREGEHPHGAPPAAHH